MEDDIRSAVIDAFPLGTTESEKQADLKENVVKERTIDEEVILSPGVPPEYRMELEKGKRVNEEVKKTKKERSTEYIPDPLAQVLENRIKDETGKVGSDKVTVEERNMCCEKMDHKLLNDMLGQLMP